LPSHKFVIADDHPLFRGALRQALGGMGEDCEILEAGDFDSAKALIVENDDADLVLLDLTMPGASGLSGVVALKGLQTSLPIIVVSAHDDAVTIRRALELGAAGFISKSASWTRSAPPSAPCWKAASTRRPTSSSASKAMPRCRTSSSGSRR